MKKLFQKLGKFLGYSAATIVILLAIAVGLFRLFLPRLPEYQDQIKIWASDAIGMEVEFSGMNARWVLSGPELEFYDAELVRPDRPERVIAAQEVSIGVSLTSLLFERALVVDRVAIRNTTIEVRQLEDGGWWVQGLTLDELPENDPDATQRFNNVEIVGEDLEVLFLQPGDERPRSIRVSRTDLSIDPQRIAFDATVRLSAALGRDVSFSATQMLDVASDDRIWDISIEAEEVQLAGWSALQQEETLAVLAGEGDLDLSLVLAAGEVRHAIAEVDFSGVSLVEGTEFDLQGRVELDRSFDGWLVAADDFNLETDTHEWPESSLRAEAGVDANGEIAMLTLRASYLRLDDFDFLLPVIPEAQRSRIRSLAPSGEVRNLSATVSDVGGAKPQFDVSANFFDAGIAADNGLPGLRGFSGQLRANRAGGRIEIASTNLSLDLPSIMDRSIDIESADGTVLWRSGDNETIVLSDSVRIVSPILDIDSNVRLMIDSDGGAPDIDLASSFIVHDLNAARDYLPGKVMPETLYAWFQHSLVKGSIQNGRLNLNGPLDKFPFDNGEGRLLLEATARNTTLKFHPDWPAAEQANLEIVLENTHLYSRRNRLTIGGNEAVNTSVDIPELRLPVLTIQGLVTGTLESFRQFAMQSPINNTTGGNLARLTVAGESSINLSLTVPLTAPESAVVDGLLRSNNGTLAVEGLDPPLTDLIGDVQITRESISGDSLGAHFLGDEVNLAVSPSDDPRYFAVVTARGTTTATALVEELGVPLDGLISGATTYTATVSFPSGNQESPLPLSIDIESDLVGLAVDLPEPARKPAADARWLRGDIRFMPGSEVIESVGTNGENIGWQVSFNALEDGLDLDRGMVTLGGGEIQQPDTRGLHIRGTTDTVRLDDWLNVAQSGEAEVGAADRIRSIDLTVDNLFAVGQHLQGHHVRLDRSALDWLVQIEGENVVGSILVPYAFDTDRAMVIDMERLYMLGDDVTPPTDITLDPRSLPPIQLKASDFALGPRRFGSIEMSLRRIESGLEIETLTTKDDTFEFTAAGQWIADDREALGSRTYLTASLNSTDVEPTLARLDFVQGISGESMGIVMDLSWAGAPRGSFLDVLDGEVRVRMEQGQLEEVEPGAGRMLGLVSFVALPRRLSLDFRDVFSKGFGYDSIAGTFQVVDGNATTCDLLLQGPAADIGIVGSSNLATGEYQQGAIVSPQVGATLPIVGAVVGGPPGAAVMLIFSQIFKKPLQEFGQVYYGISGPWDDPAIESVDEDVFVAFGDLAGCLSESERE